MKKPAQPQRKGFSKQQVVTKAKAKTFAPGLAGFKKGVRKQ
jgi:hypothetical protein